MERTIDELLGSRRGAARRGCGSQVTKSLKTLFRKLSRNRRKLKVVCNAGGCVNLIVLDYTQTDIAQLIMELKGNINNNPRNL